MSQLVWYAAFGSNLLAERFLTYLQGGPVPHSTGRVQAGARDPRPPRAESTTDVAHRLYFGRSARSWGGGGVAFLDPERSEHHRALCRLWLITAEQFEDVFAQENGRTEPAEVDLDAARANGALDLLDSWYGRVVHLGSGPDDHPILTLTTRTSRDHRPRAAHSSYLRVVGLGLMQSFGFDPTTAAHYLTSCDGNRGRVATEPLAAELALLSGGP